MKSWSMTPEEITVALPHLELPQIHAALSYYYAHKTELDKEWKKSLRRSGDCARRSLRSWSKSLARLKIYTDENVDVRVAEGLRQRGVEASTAYDEHKAEYLTNVSWRSRCDRSRHIHARSRSNRDRHGD